MDKLDADIASAFECPRTCTSCSATCNSTPSSPLTNTAFRPMVSTGAYAGKLTQKPPLLRSGDVYDSTTCPLRCTDKGTGLPL